MAHQFIKYIAYIQVQFVVNTYTYIINCRRTEQKPRNEYI